MNVSQEQITEMLMSMHKQCEFFAHSVQYNPRDDTSFASWGSMLMHLSMVCEQQDEKKKYLKQAVEKLERALELNQESRTHEGELAVFSLGNALYFEFFLEKNDTKAETSLKAAKLKFEESMKREPSNVSYGQMLEQLDSAREQRKAAHEHLARLEGKTEEEKKIEIRTMQTQMLISVVDGNRKAVESDPTDPVPLSELAKSLFELSMLQMRDEARITLKEALDVCQKSISINSTESAVIWVRGVLRQAYGMVTSDTDEASKMKAEAKIDFEKVMNLETDSQKRDALKKEKELLEGTMMAWMDNITSLEVGTGIKSQKASTKSAQRSAPPPPKTSSASSSLSPGNKADNSGVLMVVGGVVLAAAAVWWFTRSKK
mmetsp:Transcript_38962/g.57272  ORF Transcript_38962/g.57272 Transcript_38962/m.57272 type:complete len:374 (+) Transcript_38962:93-1214(+)